MASKKAIRAAAKKAERRGAKAGSRPTESDPKLGHILSPQLREARELAGWSRSTLAARAGCSEQAIKRLEAGIGTVAGAVAVMKALDFRITGLPGKSLHEGLANRRLVRKWSVERVAAKAGMSPVTVRALERGAGSLASLERLLAAIAPKLKRRAPERVYWGETAKTDRDSRFTPDDFMQGVYAAFGPVDLDPCAHPDSPVIASRRFLLQEGDDGLRDPWCANLVFVNPPYSKQLTWVRRAVDQWRCGNARTVLCLVPVRSDSEYYLETLCDEASFYALKGRMKFLRADGPPQSTPFALQLIVLGAEEAEKQRFAELVEGRWKTYERSTMNSDPVRDAEAPV